MREMIVGTYSTHSNQGPNMVQIFIRAFNLVAT